jgi:hypothetical protein
VDRDCGGDGRDLLQLAISTRVFDPTDIIFNATAATFGVSLCAGADRLIRPRKAQAESPGGTESGS